MIAKKLAIQEETKIIKNGCCIPIIQDGETKRIPFSVLKNHFEQGETSPQYYEIETENTNINILNGWGVLYNNVMYITLGFISKTDSDTLLDDVFLPSPYSNISIYTGVTNITDTQNGLLSINSIGNIDLRKIKSNCEYYITFSYLINTNEKIKRGIK